MSARLSAATTRLQAARSETAASTAEHVQARERVRALSREMADLGLSDTQRDTYAARVAQAVQESKVASEAAQRARAKFSAASLAWHQARRDYDATPRGLADLQAAAHAATDPAEQESVRERTNEALDRIQHDEDERARRWGSSRSRHFVPATALEETSAAARAQLQDEHGNLIRPASAKENADGSVAFTFYGASGSKGTTVTAPSTAGGRLPSVGALVESLRARAREQRGSSNFAAHCKAHDVDRTNLEQRAAAKRSYARARKANHDGERIFGVEGWQRLITRE